MIQGFLDPYVYFTPDGAAGGAAGGAGAAGTASDQAGQQATTTTGTPSGTTGGAEARFTQEEVNRFLAEEKRKLKQAADAEAARLKQAVEDKARAEAGEYQQLAEQRALKLAEVEQQKLSAEERLAAYGAAMEDQLRARLKALPEEMRSLDPGGDILARYEWVARAEVAAAKLKGQQQPRQAGTNIGPNGTGSGVVITSGADMVAQKRGSLDYGM